MRKPIDDCAVEIEDCEIEIEDCEIAFHTFSNMFTKTCILKPLQAPNINPSFVVLKVSRDRKSVAANVGHAALVQYLNTQVGAIDVRSDKQRAQWRLGIGPWVGLPEASGVRFSWVEVSQERPNISN